MMKQVKLRKFSGTGNFDFHIHKGLYVIHKNIFKKRLGSFQSDMYLCKNGSAGIGHQSMLLWLVNQKSDILFLTLDLPYKTEF